MAEAKPLGGIGLDHAFKKTMVSSAEPGGIGERLPLGMDKEQSQDSGGEEEAHEYLAPRTPNQDFGEGVHGGGDPEQVRGVSGEGGVLVPEDAEALAPTEMLEGAGQHTFSDNGNSPVLPKPV